MDFSMIIVLSVVITIYRLYDLIPDLHMAEVVINAIWGTDGLSRMQKNGFAGMHHMHSHKVF